MTPVSSASPPRDRFFSRIVVLIAVVLACRLVLLIFAPHCDPSESRYAEIARKMAETGNWVTPQFAYGVPFWAKPPLSMWMSALGIELFGANEFGSRIFIFLAALGVMALVAQAAKKEFRSNTMALIAATLLWACPLFFYCSAAVMTDLALLLGTTLAMVSFRYALITGSRVWGFLFFISMAIGLLAKGPLVAVIAGPPLLGWCILTGKWRVLWKRLPWISGTLLMLVISVPWYLLAEKRTPGFLDYFLIGEHIRRFTVKGWKGDLYGKAHSGAIGMIWVYAIVAIFPWCLGFFAVPLRSWRNLKAWSMEADGRGLYWVLWAIWPLVFFTPARNVIATYPLPAVPAMVLLLVEICWRREKSVAPGKFHPLHPALIACFSAVLAWAVLSSLAFPQVGPKFSEKNLVSLYKKERRKEDRLLYFRDRKYSAEFYTDGAAETTDSEAELRERLQAPGRLFVATKPKFFDALPFSLRNEMKQVGHWGKNASLYVKRMDNPAMTGVDPARTSPIGN